MKIYIGITQEPARAKAYIEDKQTNQGCFTEFGPFLSIMDAMNWLTFLKSQLPDFEEIIVPPKRGCEEVWFGYTYEERSTIN